VRPEGIVADGAAMDFYDEIADTYDEMTGSHARSVAAAAFAAELARRYGPKSVLDVACGTGVYTAPLARIGLRAVGTDISGPMLDQARRRADRAGVAVDWICAAMQDLPGKIDERFDAVLCMGNSIPHLLEDSDLAAAAGGFVELLNPGGVVVIQVLNYAAILARGERVIGINRRGGRLYVRFYDFLPGLVRFNLLAVTAAGERPDHKLHTTTLRPYTLEPLRQALLQSGCATVETYSGGDFGPFGEQTSDTLMLVGVKG